MAVLIFIVTVVYVWINRVICMCQSLYTCSCILLALSVETLFRDTSDSFGCTSNIGQEKPGSTTNSQGIPVGEEKNFLFLNTGDSLLFPLPCLLLLCLLSQPLSP